MAESPISYQRLLDLLYVEDEAALKREAQSIVGVLEFECFMYGRYLPATEPDSDLGLYLLGTYPDAWLRLYAAERLERIDPTTQHSMRHANPIPWTRELFAAPAAQEFYEMAVSHGLASGITAPCLVGTASFGVARDSQLERSHADALRVLPWVHLLGGFIHEAVDKLLSRRDEETFSLSRRERQCLERMAQGQRIAEIADGLRIAERTVLMHLANVRRKLKAQNRAQMIARGIKLGLIRP